MTISVLDYGAGNAGSVLRMIDKAQGDAQIITTAHQVLNATQLILPGVGAFDHGMTQLRSRGLVEALNEVALVRRIPVLGICLGMHLMCRTSEEGEQTGLGWVDATVCKFPPASQTGMKVPHMGWNTLSLKRPGTLLPPTEQERRYYFVHSYYVKCGQASDIVATTDYGQEIVAAFEHDNLMGMQFHAEKSHRFGLDLISRFVRLQHA